MDLHIQYHTCNKCGVMISPPSSISTKSKKIHKVEFVYPAKENTLPNEHFMSVTLYNEIQEGLHDDTPNLVRFKSKSHGQCIGTLRSEYNTYRNTVKNEKATEATNKVNNLTPIAKNVTKTETPDKQITVEAERYESVTEGNESNGLSKCPQCGFVLVSWSK